MKIRLDKIGAEPFSWQETVAIATASLERTQLLEIGEVDWSGTVWVEDPGYRCEATYSYEQTVACDRCLAPIVHPVVGEVRLLLMPNSPETTAEEVQLTAEDLEILPLEGEEFLGEEAIGGIRDGSFLLGLVLCCGRCQFAFPS